MNNIKSGHGDGKNATYLTKNLYAQTFYHELMHPSSLVNRTNYVDLTDFEETYGPYACAVLAKNCACKGERVSHDDVIIIYASSMYNGESLPFCCESKFPGENRD